MDNGLSHYFSITFKAVTGADPGIFGRGGGPNCTQYVETVLQLITSTLR